MFERSCASIDTAPSIPLSDWSRTGTVDVNVSPGPRLQNPLLPVTGMAVALVVAGSGAAEAAALADRVRALGGLVVWMRPSVSSVEAGTPLPRRLRPQPAMKPGDLHLTTGLAHAFDETICDLPDRLALWGLETVWIVTGGANGDLMAAPAARQAHAIGFRPTLVIGSPQGDSGDGVSPVRAALAADGIPITTVARARDALDRVWACRQAASRRPEAPAALAMAGQA